MSELEFEATEPVQLGGIDSAAEPGSMRETEESSLSAGRVPGQVDLGQEDEEGGSPPPSDFQDRVLEARDLIARALAILGALTADQESSGLSGTQAVRAFLEAHTEASVPEIVAATGVNRERVATALRRLGDNVQRTRRGVYRWAGPPPPGGLPPAPPVPYSSSRLIAKLEREAEAARLAATHPLNVNPAKQAAVAAILRPYVPPDDSEHAEKLKKGEVATLQPPTPHAPGAGGESDSDYEIVKLPDESWRPKRPS